MKTELETYWSEDHFVLETYRQVQKDLLGLFDAEISKEHLLSNPYPVLHEFILRVISKLAENSDDRLAQFIYKVDLKESRFLSFISVGDTDGLAHEILHREAQKVYLRRKFSS